MINPQNENDGSSRLRNVAVILAGGSGHRFAASQPKQFLPVKGKMLLEYSLETFVSHPAIDEVVVVAHPDYLDTIRNLCSQNSWLKVKQVLPGGQERYQSSLAAIDGCRSSNSCNLIFHDAARPLVSAQIITDVSEALRNHEAVNVAVPVVDTILETDESGCYVRNIPARQSLRATQTPQAFRFSVISEAYRRAMEAGPLQTTDDCGVVLRFMPEIPVFIVSGESRNFKVTYPEDLSRVAEMLV